MGTDLYEKYATQQSTPRVIFIEFVVFVQKDRPLISRNRKFPCAKLFPNSLRLKEKETSEMINKIGEMRLTLSPTNLHRRGKAVPQSFRD